MTQPGLSVRTPGFAASELTVNLGVSAHTSGSLFLSTKQTGDL